MTAISYRARDGQSLGAVPESTPAEVGAIAARAAAAAGTVAETSPAARSEWLNALADTVVAERDDLACLADDETALGLPRLTGEVERMAGQLRFYASVALEGCYLGVTVDAASASSPGLVRVNRPLGPVAVFGASNFPFAFGVLGNDTASALAAGCPVVAKAHPSHPLLCRRLSELAVAALRDAGAPQGVFDIVTGVERGADLVLAPEIAAVAFTGSQNGGLALWRLAAEREAVIPVYAEMGTVNPVVVTRAAAVEFKTIASGFVRSFTLGAGQFCTKPGLLFAPSGHDAVAVVAAMLAEESPSPVLLTQSIAEGVADKVADMVAAGAQVAGRAAGPGVGWSADAVVLTAPITALQTGGPLLEECFGPVALVIEYTDDEELARALLSMQGSLTGSVFTAGDDDPDAASLISLLAGQVGRVTRNEWPTGVAWTWAQHHGGPWPATSAPAATSVGAAALNRFVRPVAYQAVPDAWLPPEARAGNPWRVPRRVDGEMTFP